MRRSKKQRQKVMRSVLAPFDQLAARSLMFADKHGHAAALSATRLIIDLADAYLAAGGSVPAPSGAFVDFVQAVAVRIETNPDIANDIAALAPLVAPGLCNERHVH